MNILVLFSSPHKDGFTAKLLDSYLSRYPDAMVELADLYSINPSPCIDCKRCAKETGCAFDELDTVMEAFEKADAVVFAFPVYNLSFPSPLKALLDRFQRYYNARFSLGLKPPIAKRRTATVLITCGRQFSACEDYILHPLKQAFTVLNLELTDLLYTEETDRKG